MKQKYPLQTSKNPLPWALALNAFALLLGLGGGHPGGAAHAASTASVSRTERIATTKKLRVCIWPDYYGVSFRNPKTLEVSGVDADLAADFAKDLGVSLEFVESSFAKLVQDIESDRCDVAMFAVGVTPERQKKLRFTAPTMESDIFAIAANTNRRIKAWGDIDLAGNVVAVMRGTLHEPVMRAGLKSAELLVLDTPMAREQEVQSGRADVFMTDFPYSRRMLETTDWAKVIAPEVPYHLTPYAYAVALGDDRWFARVEQFVRDIKKDGRLLKAAARYKLDPIVVRK